jgi:long-chain acyl-CoA synthetase
MEIDLELYRRSVRVSYQPLVNLSVIEIAPDFPVHTMVFLHGFGGEARQWRFQLREFASQNRVIAMDLRGHGNSDRPPSGYTLDRLVDDVLGTLDTLGITGKVTLVGHSFGGAIATEFAVRYPSRLEFLVLIATAGEFHLHPAYRMALGLPSPLLCYLRRITRNWLGSSPEILRKLYYDSLRDWVGWKRFDEIKTPTLVIRGHRDVVFEKAYFSGVSQSIRDADEVNVGHSGHMVMIERRDAVNREISRFINLVLRSWRQESASLPHTTLAEDRPWLYQYDQKVSYTVAIPPVTLSTLLHSAARRFPNRIALEYEGQSISYANLFSLVNRFAGAIRELGLREQDRVFVVLPNLPALVVAIYGVLEAGGVVVFTPLDASLDMILEQVRVTQSSFLVTLEDKAPVFSQLLAGEALKHLILVNPAERLPTPARAAVENRSQTGISGNKIEAEKAPIRFRELLRFPGLDREQVNLTPRDLAVIVYTGGTTASPKGVMLSHRNLVANAIQVRHWIPDAQEGKEIFLSVLPLNHSYGLTTALNVPITLGASVLLKSRFDAIDILHTIKRYRPTIFPGVPRMYMAINNVPGVRSYGVGSIKYCLSGSAPLPVEVQEAFERLTRGRLIEGYGLTEATTVTHANPLQGGRRTGSIGLPLPSTEARIVDLRRGNKPVPVGQIGELAIRGPQVMMGYWQDPASTQKVLDREDWLLTGDVAQMDPGGFFHLIARKADMWYPRKPGDPAFPRDVEEVLYEIPQIHEAVVVAIAGQPVAFLRADQDRPDTDAVISYCKRRLPPDLVPRLVVYMDDFPRSIVGKVLRRELANRFRETYPER